MGRHHPTQLGSKENKKIEKGDFPLSLLELDVCLLPLHISTPGSRAFGLGLNYIPGPPGSPACRQRIRGRVSQPAQYISSYTYLCVFPVGSTSLQNPPPSSSLPLPLSGTSPFLSGLLQPTSHRPSGLVFFLLTCILHTTAGSIFP